MQICLFELVAHIEPDYLVSKAVPSERRSLCSVAEEYSLCLAVVGILGYLPACVPLIRLSCV